MKKIPIPESELELMKALWERNPQTLPELTRMVQRSNAWEGVTVKTLLGRLLKKGAVSQTGTRRYYQYRPEISREEHLECASDSFLAQTFDGAASAMVSFFVQKGKLSAADLTELRKLIGELDHE